MPADLSFLGQGSWTATILGDDAQDPAAWDRRDATVTASSSLPLTLRPKGGAVIRFRPAP